MQRKAGRKKRKAPPTPSARGKFALTKLKRASHERSANCQGRWRSNKKKKSMHDAGSEREIRSRAKNSALRGLPRLVSLRKIVKQGKTLQAAVEATVKPGIIFEPEKKDSAGWRKLTENPNQTPAPGE